MTYQCGGSNHSVVGPTQKLPDFSFGRMIQARSYSHPNQRIRVDSGVQVLPAASVAGLLVGCLYSSVSKESIDASCFRIARCALPWSLQSKNNEGQRGDDIRNSLTSMLVTCSK
jgi:hypothetical protein